VKDFAEFACALADAARVVTLAAAMKPGTVEDKTGGAGFDPVTEADRGAEKAMRALIEYRFPNHGIAGEEFADRPARGRHVWSLDPIDGTRSFICGLPSWTTLIALLEDGAPVLGLIDAPRLGERYLGFGEEALLIAADGQRPLATSDCRRLAEARFSTTDPYLFAGLEAEAFERLRRKARLTRFGHDAYGYARLTGGSVDLVVESGLKPHDFNALIPVVRGAGGVIGDWEGGTDFSGGRLVAAATQDLFDEAVAAIRG
jgi:histidinol phosphatase-like enzyme (inositol monophosphatase family)